MAKEVDSSTENTGDRISPASTQEPHESSSSTEKQKDEVPADHPGEYPNVGFAAYPNLSGAGRTLPIPFMFPGIFPAVTAAAATTENPVQQNGSGIYMVPVFPFPAYAPGNLVPITYNLPSATTVSTSENNQSGTGSGSSADAQIHPDQAGLRQRHGAPVANAQEQRHDQARQVVRRMIAIHIDLLLMMKLAVVVFIFNQDGSKERLFFLLFLATLVYLYQTGALSPLIQWLAQSTLRARMPQPHARVAEPDQQPGQQDGHQEAEREDVPNVEGHDHPQPAIEQGLNPNDAGNGINEIPRGLNWWEFVKELQMIVVGFVTSLLPGFHHHAD